MSGNPKDDDQVLLSLADFKKICRKSKKKIIAATVFCSIVGACYALTRPITYKTEATFRERPKAEAPTNRSLTQIILTGNSSVDSSAVTTIKSRKIMDKAVQKLGSQAIVVRKGNFFGIFGRIGNTLSLAGKNLKVEYAHLMNRTTPVLEDPQEDFYAIDIGYEDEIPCTLELQFIDERSFKVIHPKDGGIGLGTLGEPFVYGNYKFTLQSNQPGPFEGQAYLLTLLPRGELAGKLTKQIKVMQDYNDKSLIILTLTNPRRHALAKELNTIMDSYQEYLLEEHHRMTASQVDYLKRRQNEMDQTLTKMMVEHADYISTTASNIDALLTTYQTYKKRLLSIDLEIKHLQKGLQEGSGFYERYSSEDDSPLIHTILSDIRQYKQQCDAIDLALHNVPQENRPRLQEVLVEQLEQLNEIRRSRADALKLHESLDQDPAAPCPPSLYDNPKYMVKIWYDKLADSENAWKLAPANVKPLKLQVRDQCKANLNAYLTNLIHLFEVHEKTLNDRLIHQQNLNMEFQGIDLETAKGLYLAFMRDLHDMESQIAQYQFIISQIQTPNFEISSLTTILTDSVSKEIITKASSITLMLQDQSNRTTRELDRLKQELDTQKGFLTLHLEQMAQMLGLRQGLFQGKIHSIQNVMLELIHQKISILDKHLCDYTLSRINNLMHEQEVLAQHQEELKRELERFPKHWASEKLINQHLQTNMALLSEISKMIESKNISDNLEVSLSSPLDRAMPPVLPDSPRLLIYVLLGGLLGGFSTISFLMIKSVLAGVEAGEENLIASGQHVSGKISANFPQDTSGIMSDQDLNTLRRLAAYLCPPENLESKAEPEAQTLLIIKGEGPDYSRELAALMSRRGLKVLVLPISFDQAPAPQEQPGLLQYLEGKADGPKILQGELYDLIAAGGISRFSNELVESRAFHTLLQQLLKEYDWVIAVSHADPANAEAETLLKLFNHASITVADEKLLDLAFYFSIAKENTGKKISFVIHQI